MARLITLILLQLVLLKTSNSFPDDTPPEEAVFIYYDGVISGHSIPSAEACPDAKPFYFSNQTESTMFLGVYPPSVPAPFFFQLIHVGRDYRASNGTKKGRRDICINAFGGCSNDPILNLDFPSWYLVQHCRESNDHYPCYDWVYQYYNLSAASITEATEDPFFSNDTYHVMTGDYHSWVSNGTVPTGLDVSLPANYSASDYQHGDCGTDYHMDWSGNYSAYEINVTNTTVKASFTVADLKRNLTLFFEGKRQELGYSESLQHNETVISLLPPGNRTGLHFTFANGTDIQWYQDVTGTWKTTSSGTLGSDHRFSVMWTSAVLAILFFLF